MRVYMNGKAGLDRRCPRHPVNCILEKTSSLASKYLDDLYSQNSGEGVEDY